MFNRIINKIAGDYNERQLKNIYPLVEKINLCYTSFDMLTDEEIKYKTIEFKSRFQKGETLDDMLPEAFAIVKQACRRMQGTEILVKGNTLTRDMVPYDVQMIGGIALHQGKVAEMKTGEGKTLVATMPAYLNALSGNPVHIVTVNDYLASRDAEWMGHLYQWLGLTVGSINKYTPQHEHRKQYLADIVYVESTEIGFDYLRDNLEKTTQARRLMCRGLHFAIVDEADSVFIDEARTPMIMSQPNDDPVDKYVSYSKLINNLIPCSNKKKVSKGFLAEVMSDGVGQTEADGDYWIDEKSKTATLSERGIEKIERLLGVNHLYKDLGYDEIHFIENALLAKAVYEDGKDYIVQGDEVLIVDDNTGRIMPGRRYQGGLHQAIEAKEGLTIKQEAKTIATVTYQNFFKLYKKLGGMTGTATTEAEEFEKIYGIEVLTIPTNRNILRVDLTDKVYFDQHAKWNAVVKSIVFYHKIGQPILIGTSSIYTSELVSTLLTNNGIMHSVLNAKQFDKEAEIVGNAGRVNSVVVATNMAGRGTDIKLDKGLNDDLAVNYAERALKTLKEKNLVLHCNSEYEKNITLDAIKNKIGEEFTISSDKLLIKISQGNRETETKDIQYGLFVLGTEKHESRRIDNQLRGRSGRQGDAGISQFYVALDDEIMRKMGGENIKGIAKMLLSEKELQELELTQSQFTNSITRAQKQMESRNFGIRKQEFEYDSVINRQRLAVYGKRDKILFANDQSQAILLYGYKNKPEDYWFNELGMMLAQNGVNLSVPTITDSENPNLDMMADDILGKIMIGEKTTLIGYSLGGLIACRLLEKTNIKIDKLILVGVPRVDLDSSELQASAEKYGDRVLNANLDFDRELIKSKVPTISYIESTNDSVIPNNSGEYYVNNLGATLNVIDTQHNHFMGSEHEFVRMMGEMTSPSQETFLVQEVKELTAEVLSGLNNSHKQFNRSSDELAEQINQIFATEFTGEEIAEQLQSSDWSERLTRILSDYLDTFLGSMLVQHRNQYLTSVYLDTIDREWIEHIDTMVRLREKVGLYGYAQQDPLVMYKQESYHIYQAFWKTVKERFVGVIFHHRAQNISTIQTQEVDFARVSQIGGDMDSNNSVEVIEAGNVSSNVILATPKKTRPNDACPCGSGKKYKNCHGAK